MFIRLTMAYGGGPMLVNTADISHIVPTRLDGQEEDCSLVHLRSKPITRLTFRETFEDILDMIEIYEERFMPDREL